ncbi:MAG: hypothetical protein M3Y59_02775 [Myxococcota bacterium]|nr:hypothetical protein [Myxococcota bacterium]
MTGCARAPIKPPEVREYSLGGLSAPTRDYAGTGKSVCRVDRALVAEETAAMNTLLEQWLDQTSANADAMWSDPQLGLLEAGSQSLSPALDSHERVLAELAACPEVGKVDLATLVSRGQQLAPLARNRLASAPKLLADLKHRQRIAEWKAKELAAQPVEHQTWCPAKPRPIADIYYAWQDETGRTQWLFCDGNKVVAEPNGAPTHVAAEGYNPKKRGGQTPAGFVSAAKRFPDSEIRRPPALDAASAPKEPTPQPATSEQPATGE